VTKTRVTSDAPQSGDELAPRHYEHWPSGAPKRLTYPRTSLVYNFEVSARRFPEKVCVDFYGRPVTYSDAAAQIDALAGWLQRVARVRRGDRVLLVLQNSPQFLIAYYAILRADAVVVPLNPMSKSDELRVYATDAEACVAIVAHDTIEHLLPLLGSGLLEHALVATYRDYLPDDEPSAARFPAPACISAADSATDQRLPHLRCTAWRDALAAALPPGPHTAGSDDIACLVYTSGSTGQPKGCIHTHATAMAAALMFAWWENCGPDMVSLATMPFFHVSGMSGTMNASLYMGWTMVIMSRWDPPTAAKLIEHFRCSRWSAITTMAADLVECPETGRRDLSSMKFLSGGGAAMPESIASKIRSKLGLSYIAGYGMTEFMGPTHMNPRERIKPDCMGVPIFDTESCVIDLDTGRVLGSGERGEIVIRGPQMTLGYWKQPQATADAFITLAGRTFMRTGDIGCIDEDGYFFINDRLKRMINSAGYKVWPVELENIFYQHPAIQECCIVASPDERRGETVKLFAVRAPGHDAVDAESLVAWARERMANYKVPRKVEFVAALPRSSTGKIQWRALQEPEFRPDGTGR
jgi:fatty-acyl-CoA synthase